MMTNVRHLTTQELEAGLDLVRQAPKDGGVLQLIVRRPRTEERELLQQGELDLTQGLVGDTWISRKSTHTPDGSPDPKTQLTIMNSRATHLVAQDRERWPLAGDQLYIDMDLGIENLPPWTKIQIGSAVVEVTDQPHTGCKKFVSRFGVDATKFVNSPVGRQLNLRGINTRVVEPGVIRIGDFAKKI
jgi:hypothetical protein